MDGYYNSLLSFIDNAVDEGFIDTAARHIIVSAPTALELMCKLEVHYRIYIVPSYHLLTRGREVMIDEILAVDLTYDWFVRNMLLSILG